MSGPVADCTSTGDPHAGARTVRHHRVAALATLALLLGLCLFDRWALLREPLARERLRRAAVELQRAESLRAMLAAAPQRLLQMDTTREALSLAILEAAERAASVPGVQGLQYALTMLDRAEHDARTLRLAVQARVQHEQVVLDLLDALRTPVALRPDRVAGCRVLRTAPTSTPAPTPTPAHGAALTLDCAIDWSWWKSS